MTEREPDDLYDALRDRLTDFGQEPPAPLWAGIRAQLPPPVARPQLRRRKRRVALLGLLLLLLVASVGSWKLWERGQQNAVSGPELAATSNLTQRPQPGAAHPADAAAQSVASGALSTETAATQADVTASATIRPTTIPANNRPASPLALAKARLAPTAAMNIATDATSGSLAANGTDRKPTVKTTRAARKAPRALVGSATRPPARQAVAAGENGATGPSGSALTRRNARGRYPMTGAMAARRGAIATAATLAAARKPAANGPQPVTRPEPAQAAQVGPPAAAGRASSKGPARQPSNSTPDILTGADVSAVEASGSVPAANQAEARAFAAVGRLAPRLAGLGGARLATAMVPPRLVDYQAVAPARAARWAVQVLAGPALTYRYLAPESALYSILPPLTPQAATTSVTELERPALGYGGQVAVRRVLNDRWAVSAGLGYAEYATRLAIQRVGTTFTNAASSATLDSTGAFARQPATDIHRRDTYRFITVPLRVSYSVAGGSRWQLGLLGGAEVAAYIGGTSTEGTACACQTQTWGATGSPYRQLSLGLSLGAELRYHLTDRWSLLAQPTGTYFLNSLARPSSVFRQRHLFGGTALLGVSVDLP